jgi:hypothetical protein
MHAELENWNNGWHGLRLSLRPEEIDRLLVLLRELRQDPDQHFHISSNHAEAGGLGDIEVSVASAGVPDNMHLGGMALGVGAVVPAAGA